MLNALEPMELLDFEIFKQDLSYHYMCQMDRETILQVANGENKCRVCLGMKDQIRIHSLPDYPGEVRKWPSLCKTSRSHAFLIGG